MLRGAILLAAPILAVTAPAAGSEMTDAEKAFMNLRLQSQGADPLCTAANGEIVYAGPTDESLLACLEAWPAAASLRIASLGGPVNPAMVAARMIAERGMDVTVVGFCASSCGNYIVAAARRLTVLEDSAIMLHGAPLADPQAQREKALRAFSAAGIAENAISAAMLDEAVGMLQQQRDWHDAFAADFAVGSEWYDLTDYYRATENFPGLGPQLIVSPEFARACLGHPQIGSYWHPQTAEARNRLLGQIGSPIMVMGIDLPTPAACGQ
jgi:hypothetical protein